MSEGMTPYDFVQQVFYAQEKVRLDMWPTDDKYKEVLMEANLILDELQTTEDWTWLREPLVLGPLGHHGHDHMVPHGPGGIGGHLSHIPEFQLPHWVYKPSTLNHDSLRLYRLKPHHPHHDQYHEHYHEHGIDMHDLMLQDYIEVPFCSPGDASWRKERQFAGNGQIHLPDFRLRAANMGGTITFNRPLTPHERNRRVAVLDVQRRMEHLHICNEWCKGVDPDQPISYERDTETGLFINPCARIEKRIFTEIPDPLYMVITTAARHGEGSPPAQARIMGLQDQSQKILSAMRQNDAAATDADYLEWDVPGYFEVV